MTSNESLKPAPVHRESMRYTDQIKEELERLAEKKHRLLMDEINGIKKVLRGQANDLCAFRAALDGQDTKNASLREMVERLQLQLPSSRKESPSLEQPQVTTPAEFRAAIVKFAHEIVAGVGDRVGVEMSVIEHILCHYIEIKPGDLERTKTDTTTMLRQNLSGAIRDWPKSGGIGPCPIVKTPDNKRNSWMVNPAWEIENIPF
jgi:hypothetical protein